MAMTIDELLAYVRDDLARRPMNVADFINTGRAFISAALDAPKAGDGERPAS